MKEPLYKDSDLRFLAKDATHQRSAYSIELRVLDALRKVQNTYELDRNKIVTQLISDLDIMRLVESVLINDEIVRVQDVHRLMVALRDSYEAERQGVIA